MIHLRKRILSLLVHSASPPPAAHISPPFSIHRFLLSTTTSVSPKPFAVEEYLVTTCGLTQAQALKASKKLSHHKSPSKPDAVLAFLSGLGLSRPDIAAVVAADPQFLCADVEKNLSKRVVELTDLGLSRSQIARLIPLARFSFRHSSLGPNLGFWLTVFGSFDKLLEAVRVNSGLLGSDLEKVVKPNLALLQQCGITASDCPSYGLMSRVLNMPCKHVQDALARVDEFGVPRDSAMFYRALVSFAVYCPGKIDKNIGLFEELGWSRDDLLVALRKAPTILGLTEERMRRSMMFLMRDVGLEIPYIARRPALLLYSIERRMVPRHDLLKFLKAEGLVEGKFDFYNIAALGEDKFIDKFVHPYGLADAYASSCAGKHQWKLLRVGRGQIYR